MHGVLSLLIIDELPGPTIEARSGDTISIDVHNHQTNNESISIHWHGLHMTGLCFLLSMLLPSLYNFMVVGWKQLRE